MGQLLIYSFNLFNHLGKYQTKIDVFRLVKKLQFIDIENLEHKYYPTVLLRHWHQNLLHYIQAEMDCKRQAPIFQYQRPQTDINGPTLVNLCDFSTK